MAVRPDEFSLIEDLFAPLAASAPGAYGLKDDAACFQPSPGMEIVLTVDALVEGVHFLPDDPAGTIAQKLLRVNLSDLAAKGARPLGYLLAVAWRADTSLGWMQDFARGLARDQAEFGLSLWGGDTVSTQGPLTFSLTAIGEVKRGAMLRRGGALAGDDIFVTGTIGDAALGLALLQGRLEAGAGDRHVLIDRYRLPQPRMKFGAGLSGIAHSALDISDGLMADLGHLCAVSRLGARLEAGVVPLSPGVAQIILNHADRLETVLTGGDDYEILFTTSPRKIAEIEHLARVTNTRVTRVGTMLEAGQGITAVDAFGEALSFKQLGFRHF